MTTGIPLASIVVFARNERQSLPQLFDRLCQVMTQTGADWEWIVVDDHSSDDSFEWLSELSRRDTRVRAIRFSRHFGSHQARACGLQFARGHFAITLAADLQDPPEVIPNLMERWRSGAQVVYAVRSARPGESATTRGFSRLYQAVVARLIPVEGGVPGSGGYLLLDRRVIDAFLAHTETNSNSLALIRWMGFRHATVEYVQAARAHGSSKWTLRMKVNLLVNTVTAFSAFPIRVMTLCGAALMLCGLLCGAYAGALASPERAVWFAVGALSLFLAGVQMTMTGVLGEYLWRTLADARRRPRFLIEATAGCDDPYRSSTR